LARAAVIDLVSRVAMALVACMGPTSCRAPVADQFGEHGISLRRPAGGRIGGNVDFVDGVRRAD
jgi:hypothetical protein